MKSLIGKRFGHLTVVEFGLTNIRGTTYWKCACDCGKKAFVSGANLTGSRTMSCGHLKLEARLKFSRSKGCAERIDTIDDALDELGALV